MASSTFHHLNQDQKKAVLLEAANNGNVLAVNSLVALDTEVNISNDKHQTPLMLAAANGHIAVMKLLLRHKVLFFFRACSLEKADELNETALLKAAKKGQARAVKLLLKNGANIYAINTRGENALILAAESGDLDTVKILYVTKKLSINAFDNSGRTALCEAAHNHHFDIVNFLIRQGAAINGIKGYSSPLTFACDSLRESSVKMVQRDNAEAVELLLTYGADVNATDERGMSVLKMAIQSNLPKSVKTLLAYGAKYDEALIAEAIVLCRGEIVQHLLNLAGPEMQRTMRGMHLESLMCQPSNWTPCDRDKTIRVLLQGAGREELNFAMQLLFNNIGYCATQRVESLLVQGADVELADKHGSTLLIQAVLKHCDSKDHALAAICLIDSLLVHRANVYVFNKNGDTAISIAIDRGLIYVLDHLLRSRISDDEAREYNNSALRTAIIKNSLLAVKAILKLKRVDVNAKNMALLSAAMIGNVDVVNALLDDDADPNSSNDNGDTALILAAQLNHIYVVYALLARNANTDTCNQQGDTALILAVSKDHKEIVNTLLANGADVDAVNIAGVNALVAAQNNEKLAKRLLQNGANNHIASYSADMTTQLKQGKLNFDVFINYETKSLCVSMQSLSDYDVEAVIIPLLKEHPSIEIINLSRNLITNKGAILLAEFVKSNPTINELILTANKIGTKGVAALAKSCHDRNDKQIIVNLLLNPIGINGFKIIENHNLQGTNRLIFDANASLLFVHQLPKPKVNYAFEKNYSVAGHYVAFNLIFWSHSQDSECRSILDIVNAFNFRCEMNAKFNRTQYERYEYSPIKSHHQVDVTDNLTTNTIQIIFNEGNYNLSLQQFIMFLSLLDDIITFLHTEQMDINFNTVDIMHAFAKIWQNYPQVDSKQMTILTDIISQTEKQKRSVSETILDYYCVHSLPEEARQVFLNLQNGTITDRLLLTIDELVSKKQALTEMDTCIKNLYLAQKIKLFNTPPRMKWTHPEWSCLSEVKFSLHDLRMKLKNLSDLNHPNCYLAAHGRSPTEFKMFTAVRTAKLNVDEERSDWAHQLVFTPESSTILFQMHLHLDKAMVKKIVKSKNNHRLFVEISKSGHLFEKFPSEVIRLICTIAWSGLLYAANELNSYENCSKLAM